MRRAFLEAGAGGAPLPSDAPRPLKVGQAVTARHPVTRRLADGIILTMQPSRYRVQFNRRDLSTEVVRDTDVAAADPYESLPPALAVPPASRLAAPRAARARGAGAQVAAAVARRRGGGAGGGFWAGGMPLGAAAIPAVDEAQGQADRELLDQLDSIMQRKAALLGHLATMNATAAAGAHLDPATARARPEFEGGYASALADLQAVNSELTGAVARLGALQHLSVPPGQLEAAIAAAAAAQQQQQAAAAAAAVGAGGAQAAAIEAVVAEATTKAQELVAGHHAEAKAAAAAAAAGGSPAAAASQPAAAPSHPPGLQKQQDEGALNDLISACVGVLLAAKLATAPGAGAGTADDEPAAEAQQQLLPIGAVWAALDAATARVAPRAPGGAAAFATVRRAVDALKQELAIGR
jgi:hypothetical protein